MAEPQSVSEARARRHEALVVRLEALLRELRPLAARRPEGRVAEAMRTAAEGLLADTMYFLPRRRREVLPVAARRLGPLAVQLGQARAALEAFELVHAGWSNKLKAFAWHTRGGPVAVGRLRPEGIVEADADKLGKRRHAEILRQFESRIERAYDEGYADAQNGHPATGSLPWKRRG
jgi:hypothetical protein